MICSLLHRGQGLQETLERLLGATCKLFSTKCVSHELKSLGDDYWGSFLAAKKLQLHKCSHEVPISAADCLLQAIGARPTLAASLLAAAARRVGASPQPSFPPSPGGPAIEGWRDSARPWQ
jgi:hypothetical protein